MARRVTTLAYEDGEGEIRLWDPTTRRQLPNPLVNKPGIALAVLSLSPMPPCLQKDGKGKTTPGDEASGTDDEPPLPPED